MSGSIAVTGAKGFVGGHLLARLGARAIALDADVTDAEALGEAVADASSESVVHLAAASSVAASWTDAGEPWRVNALGTVNLLEAVRLDAPGARVLVVSTGEVYGQADEIPTPETAPFRPTSPYAASKAAAELAAEQFARAGSDVVVARAFQHEGPRTGRAVRGRLLGRPDRARRGSRAGNGARRRPQSAGATSPTSATWSRAYEALLDPSVPAGTYNVASGQRGRDARGARPARLAGAAARSRSRRIRRASGRARSPSCAAMRRSCGRRQAGRLRFRSSKPWPTRWTRRGRPLLRGWRARNGKAGTHHRHHRAGRLVPGRAPARQGLRGARHGPPLVDRELRAHRST